MKRQEGFLPTEDGLRLYYQILGEGPDTVIIPAASWLAADFEPLAEAHTLLLYDQRSRGQSDAVADVSHIGMPYEVSDLETVRSHFGVEAFSLIGWSYLGGVAMLYAVDHPERVDRVLLIGSIAPRDYPYDDPRELDADARLDPAGLRHLEAMREAGVDVNDPLTYSREYWRVYLPCQMGNPAGLARMRSTPWDFPNERPDAVFTLFPLLFDPLQSRDWRAKAATLKRPALVMHGMDDLVPLASSREWTQTFPESRLFLMAGVGHYPWLEDPATFFPAASQFLRGEWPKGAVQVH